MGSILRFLKKLRGVHREINHNPRSKIGKPCGDNQEKSVFDWNASKVFCKVEFFSFANSKPYAKPCFLVNQEP